MRTLILTAITSFVFASCSVTKQLEKSARQNVLEDEALKTAHVGISVFEPATGKYWFNYQGDRYFVPASNTKIPTCYAAMKYLGDSLVGLRYSNNNGQFVFQPTGDPTFLHSDFKRQPALDFLRKQNAPLFFAPVSSEVGWGSGWAWNDYAQSYMAERSAMPIYGNVVRFRKGTTLPNPTDSAPSFAIQILPKFFEKMKLVTNVNWRNAKGFSVDRTISENFFVIDPSGNSISTEVPFTNTPTIITQLLKDTLQKEVISMGTVKRLLENKIHSQPTDSLLKPLMHRSDNFFAEQSLLMVSNKFLGVMNDARIIDTILKTDFKDIPHKPRWADGSGLSRYNLFTPQDFVFILNKMKNEFGMARIKEIFPTGGEGTLSSYYKKDSTFIYAKTGTLSGVVALSGFLYTKGGKEVIFSVLVNNHQNSATNVRRAVEKFIQGIREKY